MAWVCTVWVRQTCTLAGAIVQRSRDWSDYLNAMHRTQLQTWHSLKLMVSTAIFPMQTLFIQLLMEKRYWFKYTASLFGALFFATVQSMLEYWYIFFYLVNDKIPELHKTLWNLWSVNYKNLYDFILSFIIYFFFIIYIYLWICTFRQLARCIWIRKEVRA